MKFRSSENSKFQNRTQLNTIGSRIPLQRNPLPQLRKSRSREKAGGFIALLSIVIIGAVILVISIGVSLRSISGTKVGFGKESAAQARSVADACAEYALLRLKNSLNYSGNESIIVERAYVCSILPVEGVGNNNRTIKVQAAVRGYYKKVKVLVDSLNPFRVSSWQEVADF